LAKVKLVTPQGYEFWYEAFVSIGGETVPLDDLSPEQRCYVMTSVEVNALNAAAGGRGVYRAEDLPPLKEVFPKLAGAG
jgi:hypothetical protein